MALVRYTPTFAPWPELDLFSNRLSRVFGNAWDEPDLAGNWIPAVNVEESADELLLTAELPGMREEDVNVNIENNILTIRGEKREAREEADEESRYHVSERRYGSFHRRFTLPWSVDADAIRADFEGGVLTVRLPKAPEAKSRTIGITAKTK
jgi:HSP20 family protein|tara:strand:- start:756 stop:1211 length:456 start_codon:yes stop_codon:yes gene_type:complete